MNDIVRLKAVGLMCVFTCSNCRQESGQDDGHAHDVHEDGEHESRGNDHEDDREGDAGSVIALDRQELDEFGIEFAVAKSGVLRVMATVVIGGLVTSTLLTLLVLPALYTWFAPNMEEVPPKDATRS